MSATTYNSQELSPRFRPRMSDSYHPFFLRGRKPKCLATDFPLSVKRIQGNSALNARDPVLWRNLFNPILAISTFGTRILISRERIPERACSSSNHARLRFLLITIEHRIFVPSPPSRISVSPTLSLPAPCYNKRFHAFSVATRVKR